MHFQRYYYQNKKKYGEQHWCCYNDILHHILESEFTKNIEFNLIELTKQCTLAAHTVIIRTKMIIIIAIRVMGHLSLLIKHKNLEHFKWWNAQKMLICWWQSLDDSHWGRLNQSNSLKIILSPTEKYGKSFYICHKCATIVSGDKCSHCGSMHSTRKC